MSETPPPIPAETPLPPPQPVQAPPPPSNRKLILAIILVVIIAGSVAGYVVYANIISPSLAANKTSTAYNTYSNYGFSFQYPQGMRIIEGGLLNLTASSSSGRVIGEIPGGKYEVILIAWLGSAYQIPLDSTLSGAFRGMSQATGVTSVVPIGNQGETTKAGDRVLYQSFRITAGGVTSYGVYSVWYSTHSHRLYQLALTYYLQNAFPVYQRYLNSFTEQ